MAGIFIGAISPRLVNVTVPLTQNTVSRARQAGPHPFDVAALLSNFPGPIDYFTSLQPIFCHPDLSPNW